MIPYPWPIGLIRFNQLPPEVQKGVSRYITLEGEVSPELEVHRTATEGPYVEYGGWKIKVVVRAITPTGRLVKFL